MVETKYGKHAIKAPIKEGKFAPVLHIHGGVDLGGVSFSMAATPIAGPWVIIPENHTHEYDQFLCCIGGDPMNVTNLGAEVEISLGVEEEKHTINTATMFYIPKGLAHCPLNFKRVDKPFYFLDIYLAPEYKRTPTSK